MLVKAVGQDPEKHVIAVNIDHEAIDRCKSFIKLHVEAFDEDKRFFSMRGDGTELVPKITRVLTEVPKKISKKRSIDPSNRNGDSKPPSDLRATADLSTD